MDVQLKKWGNSLGLRIPYRLADRFEWEENSTVEIIEVDGALLICQKTTALTLAELLTSISANFRYPNDVSDFVDSKATGQELL